MKDLIISFITGGAGSQLFCYAAGRRLAHKLNTEFKLDVSRYMNANGSFSDGIPYILDCFNITAKIATPEEIETLKKTGYREQKLPHEVNHFPDNVYLNGYWTSENYFPDIRDILLKEFTLKNPLSPTGEMWKQKILSAECAVSMHFRHGDFLYLPGATGMPHFHIPPIDYYYNCINLLKQQYKNLTVFVFSNDISWVKENLHLDVPMEVVEGWPGDERFNSFFKRDIEEIYLMSLCKHNINPRSAFSWWGAYLNQNPDKKVFIGRSSTAELASTYQYSLKINEKSPTDSGKWITVPFDPKTQPVLSMPPMFSFLLVVNDDAATIADTLNSVLGQNYRYYEVIIIDNGSTDGSRKICRQKIEGRENVTFKKLFNKVNNAIAWNMAFKMSKGKFVFFIKGNDRFLSNTLVHLYFANNYKGVTFLHYSNWLEENENGQVTFAGKKFSEQRDAIFNETPNLENRCEVAGLLLNQQINSFLGTKVFERKFLNENKIKFDKSLDNDQAELFFQIEALFKTKSLLCVAKALYIAPKK